MMIGHVVSSVQPLPLAVIRDRRPSAAIQIGPGAEGRPRARFGRRRRIWRSIFCSEVLSSRGSGRIGAPHQPSKPADTRQRVGNHGTNTVAIGGPRTWPRSRGPTDDRRRDRGHRRGQPGDPRRSRERTRADAAGRVRRRTPRPTAGRKRRDDRDRQPRHRDGAHHRRGARC